VIGSKLIAVVGEGYGQVGVDGANQGVVNPVQTGEELLLELLIANDATCSGKFRGLTFDLGEELGGGHVKLCCVGEGAIKHADLGLGQLLKQIGNGGPYLGRMVKSKNMS
jgi:hypothetical protein